MLLKSFLCFLNNSCCVLRWFLRSLVPFPMPRRPYPWPLWISGQPRDVIHADHDKVWLTDVDHIQPSDSAVQRQEIGDLRSIFQAFHEQWQQRWCRHDQVPFTHWNEVVALASRLFQVPLSLRCCRQRDCCINAISLPQSHSIFLESQHVTAGGWWWQWPLVAIGCLKKLTPCHALFRLGATGATGATGAEELSTSK